MRSSWALPAASGALFAAGLTLSGMTRPSKVIGFLDVSGAWDPSLAFVMVGAIAVHFVLLRLTRHRRAPLFDRAFRAPGTTRVDTRLLVGAALFGIGWGTVGYCPGPSLVAMTSAPAGVFVLAMALGFMLDRWMVARRVPSDVTDAAAACE
jgi:uncharacterized membrane protein YedE/YeeE